MTIARKPEHVPTAFSYYSCGALQIGFYAAYGLFLSWLLVQGWEWTYAAKTEPLVAYGRISLYAFGMFTLLSAIPVAVKWLLVGRWKEEAIPVWSLGYFRFWLVKTLIQSAPVVLFVGSPIYNLYLRLLGARIDASAVLQSRLVPVCTDLISVGEESYSSQGHHRARLQGAREHHLYRPHRRRCRRLHRRRQRPRHQYERWGWRAARSRVVSAGGPAHPCRPALSRLAGAGDDLEL